MQPRLTLIRVKRKRGGDAPDDLVVEGIGGPVKRAHTSLSSQLDTMTLGGGGAAPPAPSGAAQSASPTSGPHPQRFCRLATLSAAQVSALDEAGLAQLLRQRQQALQQPPTASGAQQHQGEGELGGEVGARSGTGSASTGGPWPQGDSGAKQQQQQQQQQQAWRYEQVLRRRRGGVTAFQTTEASPDQLAAFATVYEVVRREEKGDQQQSSGRGQQPTAWQQYPEGTLMCNEQPVVREPLGGWGKTESGPASMDTSGPAGREGNEEEEGEEYVYDLYAAAAPGEEGEGREDKEWWVEMHASGRAPVVQILDDDSWLVIEGSDGPDSDADTEDSNAEGFYAHDYPDEASEYSSEGEDELDPEAADLRKGGRRKGWWLDESDEEGGNSDDSGGGPWGRQVGPRPYW